MKYFRAENANRRIGGLLFEPYEVFGGALFGVYAASDPAEISTLVALTTNPANGVEEISESEYVAALKKKAPGFQPYKPLSTPPQTSSLLGQGAAVVENRAPTSKPAEPVASVDAALKLETISEGAPQPKKSAKK